MHHLEDLVNLINAVNLSIDKYNTIELPTAALGWKLKVKCQKTEHDIIFIALNPVSGEIILEIEGTEDD